MSVCTKICYLRYLQRFFFLRLNEQKKENKFQNKPTCNENQNQKYFSNDITSKISTITNNMVLCTVHRSSIGSTFNIQRYFGVFYSVFHLTTILCVFGVWLKDNRQSSHSFIVLAMFKKFQARDKIQFTITNKNPNDNANKPNNAETFYMIFHHFPFCVGFLRLETCAQTSKINNIC